MISATLIVNFKAEFGYDTLAVNGRLEATREGFSRMARSLALGSLNGIGLGLGPRALTSPEVFSRLFTTPEDGALPTHAPRSGALFHPCPRR